MALEFQGYMQDAWLRAMLRGMPMDGSVKEEDGVVTVSHPKAGVVVKATRLELDWYRMETDPSYVRMNMDHDTQVISTNEAGDILHVEKIGELDDKTH